MENELKPCPFCGAKDELEIWDLGNDEESKGKGVWVVHCAMCGCSMDWLDSKAEAMEAWNRRADDGRD